MDVILLWMINQIRCLMQRRTWVDNGRYMICQECGLMKVKVWKK